ncbi:MAG TPA: hypothetical protein VJV22_03155 [Acidobacteriaceae bacterium]|nr:hypothetical protein [Acidobacteriaceae bacterium]
MTAQVPSVVVRNALTPDSALDRLDHSRIVLAVHDVDHPSMPLNYVHVWLRKGEVTDTTHVARHIVPSVIGAITIDSLVPGQYTLKVFRPGYATYTLAVPIPARCEVDVEVYLSPRPNCLNDCRPTAPRATITTCRNDD